MQATVPSHTHPAIADLGGPALLGNLGSSVHGHGLASRAAVAWGRSAAKEGVAHGPELEAMAALRQGTVQPRQTQHKENSAQRLCWWLCCCAKQGTRDTAEAHDVRLASQPHDCMGACCCQSSYAHCAHLQGAAAGATERAALRTGFLGSTGRALAPWAGQPTRALACTFMVCCILPGARGEGLCSARGSVRSTLSKVSGT